jgi:uncharacterized protein DUF3108
VYALAACVFTWPLAIHLRSMLGAVDPGGDPSLNLWVLGWDLQTISTHPAWLFNGRVFDAGIFFPARHALAFSDHLLPQAIALWPLYAITHDLVLCYNVLFLASLVGSAWAMHALAREIVGDERAAYAGGLLFGFAPYHFTHLIHLQLQALYFLPLTLLLLHRLRAAGRWRHSAALGAAFGGEILSSAYYGVIGGIGLATAGAVLAIAPGRRGRGRFMMRGVAAAAIAAAIALPWSLAYWRVARESGAGRNLFEASHGSAVLASYVQAPETNALYGRTGWLRPSPSQRLPRKDGPEQALFPGFCAVLLAVVGLVVGARDARVATRVYGALAGAGIVLSLGPDGFRPIYAAVHDTVFGMQAIRAPARFSVLLLCAVALLAAAGVRALQQRLPRHAALVAPAVLSIATLELFNGAIAYPPPPARTTDAGQWLRAQGGNEAVVCAPMDFGTANTRCMLQSLEHGRPVVNGYSGVTPPFFAALVDVVNRLPSAESLRALHDVGVRFVVSDRPLAVGTESADVLVERARFDPQRVYELEWTPEIDARLGVGEEPPVPEPGPLPFGVGEQMAYRVSWTTGPLGLSAGEIRLAVDGPEQLGAFKLLATGKTAAWVSKFFEADAALTSTTTAALLPLAYDEAIVQSGRRVDRRFAFDAAARTVKMTVAGGDPITFPMARAARDPISTLFFLRTLPLQHGSRFSLPLADNGRQARIDAQVGPQEDLSVDGRPWRAWKVDAHVRESVERRAPPAMAVWISSDPQRIPLVLQVEGDFGTVRAELTSYRAR